MTAKFVEVSRKFVRRIKTTRHMCSRGARAKTQSLFPFFLPASRYCACTASQKRANRCATQKAYVHRRRRSGRGPIWAAGPLLRSGCRRTGTGELPGALRRLGLDPASPGLPNAAREGADSIGRLCRRPRALRSGSNEPTELSGRPRERADRSCRSASKAKRIATRPRAGGQVASLWALLPSWAGAVQNARPQCGQPLKAV